jgi:hypothetical protein
MSVITATSPAAPQTRTARGSGLLKLTATELKLLSRERVRVALPIVLPLVLIIILGNVRSFRQPSATYGGESLIDLPIPSMPAVLQHISHATPLGAAVPTLTTAAEGSMPTALQLGTLAAWAVAFGLAAARFFRWE